MNDSLLNSMFDIASYNRECVAQYVLVFKIRILQSALRNQFIRMAIWTWICIHIFQLGTIDKNLGFLFFCLF